MSDADRDAGPGLFARMEARLGEGGAAWLADARSRVAAEGASALPILFPALARRVGRVTLGPGRHREAYGEVDLGAWRLCDAAGLALLRAARPDEDALVDLFLGGDLEERTIVLRSLALSPVTPATVRLLGEVQRTNTVVHVEAGAFDHDLVVRARTEGGEAAGFREDDFHRLVLKVAFLDLPIARMFGALDHASEPLSKMLQDYATEREAAGRTVWIDTYRFLGRAPVSGAGARLVGGLENGSDDVRRAAAEGLAAWGDKDLLPFAKERLPREPRPEIAKLLRRLAGSNEAE